MKKSIFLIIILAITALALAGCFRKSIESSPPARRPAAQDQASPAEKQGIISETYTVGGKTQPVIEETHETKASASTVIEGSEDVRPSENDEPIEVEAVVEKTKRPDVGGDDLAEEPLPAQETATPDAAKPVRAVSTEPKVKEAVEPVIDPEDEQVLATEMTENPAASTAVETGSYFVQVGAFSDLENANKVLAGLLARGYKGSMLEKTDAGMYRVHAGAFADEAGAAAALEALKTDYPKGFVLKVE